jgi:two-component system response regulator HydG
MVRHAIARFAQSVGGAGTTPPDITDAAMMRLTAYSWPGNVRQLLNVVQNMVVMAVGEASMEGRPASQVALDIRHIPDDIRVGDEVDTGHETPVTAQGAAVGGTLAGTTLEQIEKRAIRETLRLTAGNREHAAKLLGIGERTLYRKLKEYGLR